MRQEETALECAGLTAPCRDGGSTPLAEPEPARSSPRGDEGGVEPPHSKGFWRWLRTARISRWDGKDCGAKSKHFLGLKVTLPW